MRTLFPTASNGASRSRSAFLPLLLGVAILLSACGNRTTGPIADIEVNDSTLTARSEGELWYSVVESQNAGSTWEILAPERYGSDDPDDPNFGFEASDVQLVAALEVCSDQTCWRAVDQTIERSDDAGLTWATDFSLPEGRERFAPIDYPTIVDMAIIDTTDTRDQRQQAVVAATAEDGLLLGNADGTWIRRPIDHWAAPSLTGSLVQIVPELAAVVIGTAIAMAVLLAVATLITRRAHEQVGQSIVLLLSVLSVGPAAYYATLPLLDWQDGTIVARQDAIDQAIEAATFYGAIAAIGVVILSLLVRFRWTRRLGPLPFPDTPA